MKQKYLEIGFKEQTKLLKEIKENSKLTWKKLAEKIRVNQRMLFFYYREKNRMPLNKLKNLKKYLKSNNTALENLKIIKMNNFKEKKVNLPKFSEELAELLGILAGDGNIDPKNNRVCVTCDSKTDHYYVTKHVRKLFKRLFNIQTTINNRNGGIRCQIYSKKLANYLELKGITKGNRKNKTNIPKKVLKNKKYIIPFLRGLFDTDGSVYEKRTNYVVVEYTSCYPKFLEQIQKELIKLGFKATLSGKSVRVCRQTEVDSFFKLIMPNNSKHLIKYETFKKTGIIPTTKKRRLAPVV
jgi:hypothetical protein